MDGPIAEDAVKEAGRAVFRQMGERPPALFDRRRWAGELLAAALRAPGFKVRLFRFLDVVPALRTAGEAAAHLREYFLDDRSPLSGAARAALKAGTAPPFAPLAALALRAALARFSRIFIAGSSPRDARPALRRIVRDGRGFSVDLLGEDALSEAEADGHRDRYLALLDELCGEAYRAGGRRAEGEPGSAAGISVKISSLYSRIGPHNHEDSVRSVKARLRPILGKARQTGVGVCLDMESRALKAVTLDVFTELLDEPEFSGWPDAGIAVQAYLRETADDLARIASWARRNGRRVTVRLVKGAYWEHEMIAAGQRNWPAPVFTAKSWTDWSFERCAEAILDAGDALALAAGTHNVRSIATVVAAAAQRGVPRDRYEFQMLYGMAEPVKGALCALGYRVREYVPVGDALPGMAYLVRRLLENSSNEGFLRKRFAEGVSADALLSAPDPPPPAPAPVAEPGRAAFRNEPALDFSRAEVRDAVASAVEKVRGELGRDYPALVAGGARRSRDRIVSVNPARPHETVGAVAAVDGADAREAVAAARAAQPGWGRLPARERAEILYRAARIARTRRLELLAWQLFEVGKSRTEADADVAEAIDYFEYYGREMERLAGGVPVASCPGEENRYLYRPRGVGVVIAPWNFPLAIPAGMASAALVAGNAVLLKPSSLSPVDGWLLCAILREAGVPEGVLQFVPGAGEAVGDLLVAHPGIDFIAFTGSREVGLRIVERAAATAAGQRGVKKVVAEMGGKNAIIVDADADLDQAIPGVIRSAFGYQGQKCSACSRAIVLAGCYDRFLERLLEAVRGMPAGPPDDPANVVGPVIDGRSRDRIRDYIALASREGTVSSPAPVPGTGFFVAPAVVTGLPPQSRILHEEIFGPVLAVVRVRSLDEALAVANGTDYALTGGFYSRSPAAIARAAAEFEVGNLYINRPITGAAVGRQPFGGFRMSGVGSKAGGPDYLLQFLEPRVVAENTVRRGFSPDVIS